MCGTLPCCQVLVGGQLTNHSSGQFYPPTVITGVTPDMRIWTEEVFGPVIVIVKGGEDASVLCLLLMWMC